MKQIPTPIMAIYSALIMKCRTAHALLATGVTPMLDSTT